MPRSPTVYSVCDFISPMHATCSAQLIFPERYSTANSKSILSAATYFAYFRKILETKMNFNHKTGSLKYIVVSLSLAFS